MTPNLRAAAVAALLADTTGLREAVEALAAEWATTVYKIPPGYPMDVNRFCGFWFKQPLLDILAAYPDPTPERACGLCRRYGHADADCPTNPANWPAIPTPEPDAGLDAVKAQAAREALLAAADDYERERIERHEIVIAALDALTTLITDVYTSHPLDIARVILVSDWLAAHDAEVARTAAKEAGERIAQAIEAMHSDAPCSLSFGVAQKRAARIVREEGRADG